MNIQAEKLSLIKWLEGINDSNIIRQFLLLKDSNESKAVIKLSDEEKAAIEKGLKSIDAGHHKTNEQVIELTKEKYPHLFKSK